MKPYFGNLGPIPIGSYTVLLDLAIIAGLVVLAWRGQRREGRPGAWVDAGLAALVAGVIGGRLGHVAIHWAYFVEHPAEIYRIWQGGLNWHGAIASGLVGLLVTARLRGVDWRGALDALAFVLPVGVALTFGGCLLARCAYGREVASLADYSGLVAAELPDLYGLVAPRLLSQGFGIALGAILLLIGWGLSRLIKREGVMFWLVLALLALGVFAIGYTLGDTLPAVGPLRLDQVLDLTVAVASLIAALVTGYRRRPEPVDLLPATPLGEL